MGTYRSEKVWPLYVHVAHKHTSIRSTLDKTKNRKNMRKKERRKKGKKEGRKKGRKEERKEGEGEKRVYEVH